MGIKQWIFHEVALLLHYFQVELDFGMLVFVTGGGNRRTREKTLGARMRSNNKLKSCETRSRNGTQATADGRQAFLPLRQPAPNKRPQ